MVAETDAARDRVLAARAELGSELQRLEASARAAVDIPAKIKRSPAKAAAVVGTVGFLALKGPQRIFGAARRAAGGKPTPLPERMLPDEIEKTLRKLGDDGEKVRGALERDFAAYAKQRSKDRGNVATLLILAAARPLLGQAAKGFGRFLFTPEPTRFSERLAEIRARAGEITQAAPDEASERIAAVRQDEAAASAPDPLDKDTTPPVA
ncbi:MAG TPA: hypothetical protein VD763_07045 [Candidatus Saccharimonadales bacterium]|nr:hypothetical protein [Candidatus Saccharimonadales bacterium]